jgi:hypothetical protein
VDGEVGEAVDLIVDGHLKITSLVVDTGSWLAGKKVQISTEWIKEINWKSLSFTVDVSLEDVKNSQEYK